MADQPAEDAPRQMTARQKETAVWLRRRLDDLLMDAERFRAAAQMIDEDFVAADLLTVSKAIAEATDTLQGRLDAQG